jgi:integrase
MSIYDRWHVRRPRGPAEVCKEHSRGDNVLYKSSEHGQGDRWQVRWRDPDGKQCSENRPKKEGKNPAIHAEARDKEIQGQLLAGTYVDPDAGKVTLLSYGRDWLKAQTGDASTIEQYERWFRLRIEPSAIAGQEMGVLAKRPSMIQKWIRWMGDGGLGPKTIRWSLKNLSMVFGAAAEDGIVSRNPCRSKAVRPPDPEEREIIPATFAQIHHLRAAMPPQLQAMVDCGYGLGMRQGEILGLGKDDVGSREVNIVRQIRRVRGQLVFSLPKGGKTRSAPLDEDAAFALIAHMDSWPPAAVTLPWAEPGGRPVTVELVFTRTVDGETAAISAQSANHFWTKARRAAGIDVNDTTGMHWLRHTFASACLADGIDVLKVARWLGHGSAATTLAYYAHFIPDADDLHSKAMRAFRSPKIQKGSARNVP